MIARSASTTASRVRWDRAERPSVTGAGVVTSRNLRLFHAPCNGAEIPRSTLTCATTVPAMPHPEVADERAHLQFAAECLAAMRARTAAKVGRDDILAANEADAEAVRWQLQRRLKSFDDDSSALCFGRIDEEQGPVFYIGRRHVEDDAGAPVVVDWRAGVATPFYRATLSDPMGLHRRRRFVFAGRDLNDIFEEDFDDPDSLAGSGGVPDPL